MNNSQKGLSKATTIVVVAVLLIGIVYFFASSSGAKLPSTSVNPEVPGMQPVIMGTQQKTYVNQLEDISFKYPTTWAIVDEQTVTNPSSEIKFYVGLMDTAPADSGSISNRMVIAKLNVTCAQTNWEEKTSSNVSYFFRTYCVDADTAADMYVSKGGSPDDAKDLLQGIANTVKIHK